MTQLTHSGPSSAPTEPRLSEELYRLLRVVLRGWRYLAVSILVCLTVAVFLASRTKPTFKGSARVLILQQGGRQVNIGAGSSGMQSFEGDDYLPTHMQIIKSPSIVEKALVEAGIKDRTTAELIGRLTVTRPDPDAKIIEIGYQADNSSEALKVVDAVVKSYSKFLETNYQKNANEVINLIARAKDDLSAEIQELERKYVDFHSRNPTLIVNEEGRPLFHSLLEKINAAQNELLIKEMQLKTQLDVGTKLSLEGMNLWTVANTLRQIGGGIDLGGNGDGKGAESGSYEQIKAALDDVELRRETEERLLAHLRSQQDRLSNARSVDNNAVAEEFTQDPEVADLRIRIGTARDRLQAIQRLARNAGDSSVMQGKKRLQQLEATYNDLWKKKRPQIVRFMQQGGNGELDSQIQKVESQVIALRSEESVLRERLEPLRAEELTAVGNGTPDGEKRIPDAHQRRGQQQTQNLLASIERSLEAIRTMRKDMKIKFDEDLAKSKDTELLTITEANLKANLERHRMMHAAVVQQLKQAQLSSDYSSIVAQTLNPPSVSPGRRMDSMYLMMALVLGSVVGIGFAFLVDLFDPRIRTLPELRRVFDVSLLGVVPQLARLADKSYGEIGLISETKPRSLMAELYKSIRTKLEFHRRSGSVQVILVASPHSGDGKSTTASNLAISLAHAGRKTLLIDADLRRASLHHIFALERDMGLVQILKDNAPLESVVQPTLIQNLDFVSSGPEVDNPAELLASSRLNEFLNEARGTYDVVIIDSPPILAVTDPCVISSSVDGIVLIVRASTIKRADAEHTMELLRTLGIPVLGTVINGITREQAGYGYGYGQGYGYGYGYGYGGYVYGGDRGPARPLDGVPGNGVPGNGVGAASVPMELTRPSSDPEHGSNMPLPPANS